MLESKITKNLYEGISYLHSMTKRTFFIFTSLLLLIALILSTISSNLQNEKYQLLIKEIKRTQDYNVNLATINAFYEEAAMFYDIENLSGYADCNKQEYKNLTTCGSLAWVETIKNKTEMTDEIKYFYGDNFSKIMNNKSALILWIDISEYLLLFIAFVGQMFILLYTKEKDF